MPIEALASDFDGTLALDDRVSEEILDAIRRLRGSGRRFVQVTGRRLDRLLRDSPCPDLCDRIVAENGALLYDPADRSAKVIGERPPGAFIAALRQRGVGPLSIGEVIVSTSRRNLTTVVGAIDELGLELQVISNRGDLMVLPAGVNKGTGLRAALDELGISPGRVVGVGNAENDHSMLALCGRSAAVADAVPAIKGRVDIVLDGPCGGGVVELIDLILDDDPGGLDARCRGNRPPR